MNWKFWKKESAGVQHAEVKRERLTRPQAMPPQVGKYLVVKLGKNPDWVWNLKAVTRKREDKEKSFDVRVFDETKTAQSRVIVKDYTSLDAHPELILFEGWFDKKSWDAYVEEKGKPAPLPKAA